MTNRKARIAIVSTMAESPWGGSEELWSQMAASALEEGHAVMALIPGWRPRFSKVEALVASGLQVAEWPECNTSQEQNIQAGRAVWYPYHPLLDFAPDIVCVSHGGLLDSVNGHILLIQMLLESRMRFIVIIQANTDLYFPTDTQRQILRAYFSRAETLFFVSSGNLEIARRQLAAPLENAELINNPVNMQEYGYVPWPEEQTAQFACVARFDTWAKGQDLLFEVLGLEKWRSREWRLRLFGKGVHEQYFRELIGYFRLENFIDIPGESRDVRQIWADHHLLILPSRLEGTPLVLFEAMLCGRPAVVTEVGGNADWIADNVSGFVARAASISLLDEALERAWLARDNWRQMGAVARETFLANHEIQSGKTLLQKIVSLCGADKQPYPTVAPTISVIVPCYNYGRYLAEAVESVLEQSCQDFEVIIINDGSTDDTRQVAEGLVARYPSHCIRLMNQENSGQPAISRNNGIRFARGRYILCLDADDRLAPSMLKECLQVLEGDDSLAIAYTDRQDFDGVDEVVHAGDYDFDRLVYENHISYCALYRKEVWEAVGGYRLNVKGVEDWDFWIAAGALGYRGRRIAKPLFWYRRHDTGIFQDVLKDYDRKFAQIVLNNGSLYPESVIDRARQLLESAKSPAVSVIVPTYNRPEMLREAIRSILDQTFKNFEIIVVNDAGQDVSSVVQSFNSPKIVYLSHETNKGLAATRNTGIRAASGKYIAYLDDDDAFFPEHLETLVAALEGSDYRVAYTDARRAFLKREGTGYVTTRFDTPYAEDFDYERILWENFIPVLCIMHERGCLEASGLLDETLKRHEDWDLWIRMSRDFAFLHIPKITCQFAYLEDGSGMTSGTLPMYLGTCRYIYQKYRQLTGTNTNVVQHQKSVLYSINSDVINFIGDRISHIGSLEEIPFEALTKAGATAAQIASAFYALAAARCGDAALATELLERAITEYPENYQAAASLTKQYIGAGRIEAALGVLSFLQSRNPLDPSIAELMERLQGSGIAASIIIPAFNQRRLTEACIAAIGENTGNTMPYEVIVVDNASTDDTAEYLTSLGDGVRTLTNSSNLGFARACNQGAATARGEYLVFLNNDTLPQPGWLEGLVRGAVEGKADIVGAKLLYPDGTVQHAGIAFSSDGIPYHIFRRFPGDAGAVNGKWGMKAVTGACMLVRAALFRELGGFDEGYVNGFEDVDLCLRAWQEHRRILYTPESVVVHYEESTPGRKAHDAANMARFMAKWDGVPLHDDDARYAAAGLRQEHGPDGRIRIVPV